MQQDEVDAGMALAAARRFRPRETELAFDLVQVPPGFESADGQQPVGLTDTAGSPGRGPEVCLVDEERVFALLFVEPMDDAAVAWIAASDAFAADAFLDRGFGDPARGADFAEGMGEFFQKIGRGRNFTGGNHRESLHAGDAAAVANVRIFEPPGKIAGDAVRQFRMQFEQNLETLLRQPEQQRIPQAGHRGGTGFSGQQAHFAHQFASSEF